jgi:hypothetical protein
VFSLMLCAAMKKTKWLLLGFLSSVLLSIGFARAAETIDPITIHSGANAHAEATSAAPETAGYCDFVDNNL